MIRQAQTSDIPRIAEIAIFTKRYHYRQIFQDDLVSFNEMQVVSLAEELTRHPREIANYLVYDDGILKGYAKLVDNEVRELYVDIFFQKEGIGSALLQYGVTECGVDHLWVLEKNHDARKFYLAQGFVETTERMLEPGTEELKLKVVRP